MSDSTNVVMQRAFELIENDELEQAQELLAPLLETDDENPSLWWVYSHSLRDQSLGQLALDRVLELDPSYPGANELKEDLLEFQSRDLDYLQPDAGDSVTAQEVVDHNIDDWDDVQLELEDSSESAGGRHGAVILAVILFIVAAGITLVASGTIDLEEVLSGILPTPEAEIVVVAAPTVWPATAEFDPDESATEVTAEATVQLTDEATAITTAELTEAATTAQDTLAVTPESTAAPTQMATASDGGSPIPDEAGNPLSAFVRDVADSISDFEIDRRASAVHSTLLGRTIVIQVCAVPGTEFNTKLNLVINAMVVLVDTIPEDIDAVAAGLLNCDDEDATLRIIGVAVETIRQYLDEDIDAKAFQRAIQPLS